jgi:peptidoglycan/LPS O-acetylase OafA/YrhL
MDKHALTYRPDIDGLRALAIMGVLIFHLNGHLLSGGFIGVDVFFVISGFLISSIIDRDLGMGNFSIARFYDRRIRRIVPALFVVICMVLEHFK